MRTLPLLTLVPLGVLACSMSVAAPAQTQELSAAKKLSISGAYTTELSIGDRPKITIEGPASEVIIKADKDRIEISRKADNSGEIKLTIVVAGLDRLDLSGAQKLRAKALKGDTLELEVSGACDAELGGAYIKLDIDLSGASKIDASKLAAKVVDLQASGASNIQVDASEQLRVEASGASKVRYTGAAEVEKELSGVASVEKR